MKLSACLIPSVCVPTCEFVCVYLCVCVAWTGVRLLWFVSENAPLCVCVFVRLVVCRVCLCV